MSSAGVAGRAPSSGVSDHAADAALADLYQSHSRWVLARCRASLHSREEAEDAMQVTFLQAFRAFRRGVVPRHELAWLGTIADNVCRSSVRTAVREARREASVEQELRCSKSSVAVDDGMGDELAALKRGLGLLPETQRRAILLREWAGMSTREIALELETSVTAVEMLLHRARRALSLARAEGRWRRAFDLTSLVGALRQLLSGGGTAAKVAAAVSSVAVATTGVAASAPDSPRIRPDARARAPIAGPAILQAPADSPGATLRPRAASPASPTATTKRVVSTPAPASKRRPHTTPSAPATGATVAPTASAPALQPAELPSEHTAAADQTAAADRIAPPAEVAPPPVAELPAVELPVLPATLPLPELPPVAVPVEPPPVAVPPLAVDPLPALPELPAPPAPPALPRP
jgi:RNA polymerase sigma factor (sigma-70 family)